MPSATTTRFILKVVRQNQKEADPGVLVASLEAAYKMAGTVLAQPRVEEVTIVREDEPKLFVTFSQSPITMSLADVRKHLRA